MIYKNFSEKRNTNKPGAILSGNLHIETIKLKKKTIKKKRKNYQNT